MKNDTKLVLNLSKIRAADLPLVGGKGANLGEMIHAGIPVPPGFCVTTRAFELFITACSKSDALYEMLDKVNPDDINTLRQVGQQVRQALLDTPFPEPIVQAVREAWKELGTEHSYAVRSSATAEDLPEASFAGQQDTYLNVIGESALLDAIKKCWVSLFNDRAITYRIKNNFPHRDVKLSVIVQRMIFSEKSGIMFTAHPVTGHRHTLTIDASYGLGEAIVSGMVTPDSYAVDKRKRKIIERKLSEKKVAIYPREDGGTHKVILPKEKRKKPVLNKKEILQLTDLGCKIESHYGAPQDIEWGIVGKEIYILQSRPITSLYPIEGLEYPDGTLGVFFSVGHQQSMTRVMTPLSQSTIKVLMPLGRAKDTFESTYVRSSGSRLFADITLPLRHRILRRGILNLLGQLDALAPRAIKQVTKRPEFKRSPRPRIRLSTYRAALRLGKRVYHDIWKRDLTGFVSQINELIENQVIEVSARIKSVSSPKEKVEVMLDVLTGVFPFFLENWVPEAAAGLFATRLLKRWAGRWLTPEEVEDLVSGIPGNVVNEMNMAIGDLADIVRHSPHLVKAFEDLNDDGTLWLKHVEQVEGSAPFLKAWNEFIAKYGARGPSEIDIYMPRYYEDPLPVLKVIQSSLEREQGHHRRQYESLVKKREAAMQKLLEKAGRGLLGGFRTRRLQRLYKTMLDVGGMREHHKFYVMRIFAIIKENIKEVGQFLVQENKLENVDDVWFLTWSEILKMLDDEREETINWKEIIRQRKKDLKRHAKLAPPMIITSDGETPVVSYQVKDAPKNALLGNPVSPGVAEGIARVISDPKSESLAPNEILVAEFTDPGWTPLFINAKALILEVGGALTHGAVVAREYGIPAVVGVKDATKRLKSGDKIRVDGNQGIIEILQSE